MSWIPGRGPRLIAGALLLGAVAGSAQEADPEGGQDDFSQSAERARFAAAANWDFAGAEVRTQQVAGNLHVLFGIGGNVLASIGEDGVLLVDDQFPEMSARLGESIEALGGGPVDFVINTHWHFDHADGNLTLGPGGAWIVAHAASRAMLLDTHVIDLVGFQYTQQPYPQAALPVISYDRTMQMHFNGERIDLLHFGPAHTTGDTAVIFRGSNVVHLGDVYNNAGYPFIDVGNGGDLDGVIAFCQAVLEQIDADTVVVPGHGPVGDFESLEAYVAMLQVVRDRIAALVADGADLQAVLDAAPTGAFDEKYGNPARFVDRAYFSLVGAGEGSAD